MSLYKIYVTRGSFSYSVLIQARSLAQAIQYAKTAFKSADKREVIQLG